MAHRKIKLKLPSLRNLAAPFGKLAKGPSLVYLFWFCVLLIFLAGQWMVNKGQIIPGISLSCVALGAAFLVYYYGFNTAWELLSQVFGAKPGAGFKGRGGAGILKGSPRGFSGFNRWPGAIAVRLVLILAAFVLAWVGQSYFGQAGSPSTFAKGAKYFLAAAVLFVAVLWSWRREGLKEAPLPFKTEMIALGAILAVAAFLRVWRINSIPSGLFIDQGFQGYAALRILHEGWFPFYVEEIFHAYALGLYMLAGWFALFGASDISLRLFYVFLSLVSLPLIYWTFRQLAGQRAALLTVFILAVMRWQLNFSRNGFPTVQLPLYMFGTLAFLLYGLKTSKRWAYIVSAVFFSAGFYTYQAFKVFPMLLFVYALYEFITDWKNIRKNRKLIALFLALSVVLSSAFVIHMYKTKNFGTREAELSIWPKIKQAHSLKPFWEVVSRTAIMFNRQGDPNPRHNLQDYRMLDDVSGSLLILGLAWGLARGHRRKYFWALGGFFIMSFPCTLSIDAAHANRMFGVTPFMAFLIAAPLTALWGRVRTFLGGKGEILFLVLLAVPLGVMTQQNYDVYFRRQANNQGSWAEYSINETTIGREIAKRGKAYEYYISPRYCNFFSILFYSYRWQSQVHSLDLPGTLVPLTASADRGLFFALENGRRGILDTLQKIYPEGKTILPKDPSGQEFVYFFEVPPEAWAKARGLTAEYSNQKGVTQAAQFPKNLPPGPYHASFTGSLYADQTGDYEFLNQGPGSVQWMIDGSAVSGPLKLVKGYHPIQIDWNAPQDARFLSLEMDRGDEKPVALDTTRLTTLRVPRGLLAKYFATSNWQGKVALEQWETTPNYTNGNDFSHHSGSALWEGRLRVPASGDYQFSISTGEQGGLSIDGNEIIPPGSVGNRTQQVHLEKGVHPLTLFYRSTTPFASCSLYWKKPKAKEREVIPVDAFE
jgi:4-amino-4-deoxy-L-arabinose transferase-like glycosyltransferase